MTKLTNPLDADVFIVGKNQRNGYDRARLDPVELHRILSHTRQYLHSELTLIWDEKCH